MNHSGFVWRWIMTSVWNISLYVNNYAYDDGVEHWSYSWQM